jgi:hypothetical protein
LRHRGGKGHPEHQRKPEDDPQEAQVVCLDEHEPRGGGHRRTHADHGSHRQSKDGAAEPRHSARPANEPPGRNRDDGGGHAEEDGELGASRCRRLHECLGRGKANHWSGDEGQGRLHGSKR